RQRSSDSAAAARGRRLEQAGNGARRRRSTRRSGDEAGSSDRRGRHVAGGQCIAPRIRTAISDPSATSCPTQKKKDDRTVSTRISDIADRIVENPSLIATRRL